MFPAELAIPMQSGRTLAEEELRSRGVGGDQGAGVGPMEGARAPVAVAADSDIWVLYEFVKGRKIGEAVTVPDRAPRLEDRALIRVTDSDGRSVITMAAKMDSADLSGYCEGRIASCRDAEASAGEDKLAGDDVRTMSVKYLANGDRGRNFKDTVKEYVQVEFDDWPLHPRTCQDCLNAICEVAESCYTQHLAWVQQARIPEGDRAIYEDELLSKVIDTAGRYDYLNIVNLASFEMII